MTTKTNLARLATAINSLEEYLRGVWGGEEGMQAVISSLRIVQEDVRPADEPTCEELIEIAKAYGAALDMSDAEHADFRDSNADVIEYLWLFETPVRQALGKLASRHDLAS